MGLLLVQHGLDFLRQSIPDFVRIVRRIEQENAAGFQALRHLVFINKLQLMAANEIRLRNQIRRTNRLFADAQVRNCQAARFFGVIDKIPLRIPRR
jgi:hypothetical protein